MHWFDFLFFIFSECSLTANVQGTKCKKMTSELTENPQTRTKIKLLLYGHLYVVALLICAFLLMGKKIKKSMQECYSSVTHI